MGNINYLDFLAKFGVGSAHPGGMSGTKRIINNLSILPTSSILDVGCGTGRTLELIGNQYNCDLTGIDNNQTMVEKAKKRMEKENIKATIVQGNIENLPFPNDYFDIILSESVTSFTKISISLNEYKRVLKPTGMFIANEMTMKKMLTDDEILEIKDFYGISELLNEEQWEKILRETGFKIFQKEDIYFFDHFNKPAFDFSTDIHAKHYEIMDHHQYLTKKYITKLGSKTFYCSLESS